MRNPVPAVPFIVPFVRFFLLLCIGFLLTTPPVAGQSIGRLEETASNVGAYYYHIQPGEMTMQVRLIGAVQAPGLYVLGRDADLGDLLVLSGGPSAGPRTQQNRREIIIRLYRPSAGEAPIYERTFEQYVAQAPDYPTLQEGDLASVEIVERRRFTWRDGFTIVNTLALIALTAERFSRIN